MAVQSLWTGLSALNAANNWLDTVASNLSNVNTVGYAQNQNSFADTLTAAMPGSATAPSLAGRYTPLGWRGGTGVMATPMESNFSQMPLQQTNRSMDFAIQGPGFFQVQGANGQKLLTKAGDFTWAATGNGQFELALPNGMPVLDTNGKPILISQQPSKVTIAPNGQIQFGQQAGPKLALVEVSQPQVSLVPNGDTTYALRPGWTVQNAQNSTIQTGYLAMSNVNMAQAMTDLMQAQEMYNMNAESIQMENRMQTIAVAIKP